MAISNSLVIPRRTDNSYYKYEAKLIFLKTECREGCKYYRKLGTKEYCGGGKNFKILIEREKRTRCSTLTLITKKEIPEHSIKYIDQIINNLEKTGFIIKNAQGGIEI